MNQIKIFENPEFGKVRSVEIDGKPYFCGSDIAEALGYAKPNNAVAMHCRATLKQGIPISGKIQEVNFIPEGDVYRLVVRSKLPSAEKFERWVFDEVLPSIRKSGGYIAGQEQMTDSELMAKALLVAQKQIEERNAQIERMKPKEIFADIRNNIFLAFNIKDNIYKSKPVLCCNRCKRFIDLLPRSTPIIFNQES